MTQGAPVKNSLTLRAERLAELTTDDLANVQGAAADTRKSLLDCLIGDIHTLHGCTTAETCP